MIGVLGVEIGDGLRAIRREPAALFFSVLMPVMFFALFASLFGGYPSESGLPVATTMVATFGAFAVVSVTITNPGISVAADRESGWLRTKKVSAAPVSATVIGKVVSALPYAAAVLIAISLLALAIAGPAPGIGAWLRLMIVLVLGSLPFAFLSLAVGFVASSNATAAICNAVLFPLVIASGLWLPLEILPGWVQAIAPWLPTYHLGQLALAQLTGGPMLGHVAALALTTIVTGGLAGLAYRNLRV